jgi:hypothetical protein
LIVAGEGVVTAVTPSKSKAKSVKIDLPEKLEGPNPDAAFMPKAPIPVVPGTIGQEIEPSEFSIVPRPLDQLTGSWNIKVTIKDADTKDLQVRKDANVFEILAMTFQWVSFAPDERVKVLTKPAKMQDGALCRVEKVSLVARLALDVKIWDGSVRKCGIEVSPNATVRKCGIEVSPNPELYPKSRRPHCRLVTVRKFRHWRQACRRDGRVWHWDKPNRSVLMHQG